METVRFLLQEGRLHGQSKGWDDSTLKTIPAGIREIIGKRLNRLSPACCRMLSIAACVGRAFESELLARLSPETSEESLLAALEEALAAHMLEPLPSFNDYQFSHVLIRETLYEEMLPARRARLHLRIGELLEARHGDRILPLLPQLAYHFNAALPAGAADKALDYARRAAEQAAQLLAYEEAARFYQTAMQLQQQHFALAGRAVADCCWGWVRH